MHIDLDPATRRDIEDLVYDFFADNCDVERDKITPDTNIVDDLEGDSLMVLSILEAVRKKYGFTIELKTLGRHLMSKPANTVGQIIELTAAVVKHGDNILNVEL